MYLNETYEWFSPLLKKMYKAGMTEVFTNIPLREKKLMLQVPNYEDFLKLNEIVPGLHWVEKREHICHWWEYTAKVGDGYKINVYAVHDRYPKSPQFTIARTS